MRGLESVDVGGVPAYLAVSTGPTHVGLAFGVGSADEALPERGLTHLCEHLVLADLGRRDHGVNGFVTLTSTQFVAEGSDHEVIEFLHDVAVRLRHIPVDRLEQERSILRAEQAGRHDTVVDVLLRTRFGAESFGAATWNEFALGSVDEGRVQAWADRHFVAGNAVLWVAGPEPSGVVAALDLDLPAGAFEPRRVGYELSPLPGCRIASVAGPNVSMITKRSPSSRAAVALLRERLDDEIRVERGLAYTVAATYEPLSLDTAHAHVGVDVLPEAQEVATAIMFDVIDELAEGLPPQAFVDRWRRRVQEGLSQQGADAASVVSRALDRLHGGTDSIDVVRQVDEVCPESIRDAFVAAMSTALILAPQIARPSKRFPLLASSSPRPTGGSRHRPARGFDQSELLVVNGDSFTWTRAESDAATVNLASCVAVLSWEDGTRALVGPDGRHVAVAPWTWRGGQELVERIDARIPADLVVPMGAGSGPPPKQRWWAQTSRGTRIALIAVPSIAIAIAMFIDDNRTRRAETDRLEEISDSGEALSADIRQAAAMSRDGEIGIANLVGHPGAPFRDIECEVPVSTTPLDTFTCFATGVDQREYEFVARIELDNTITLTPAG